MDIPAWMFNRRDGDISKMMIFNIPVLQAHSMMLQCAYDTAIWKLIKVFENSLNDDGHEEIDRIIQDGNPAMYIGIVVERTISEVFCEFEGILDSDVNYINFDRGYSLPADELINYLTDNIASFQNRIDMFAYVVFHSVMVNLVKLIKEFYHCGMRIDAYSLNIMSAQPNVLRVTYYLDRTVGLPFE